MSRLLTYWTAKAHELRDLKAVGVAMIEQDAVPQKTKAKLPGDPLALRGIPIQGRGIGGAMRHTRPDVQVTWLDADRMVSYDSAA